MQNKLCANALTIPPNFPVDARDVDPVSPQMIVKDFYAGANAKEETSYRPTRTATKKNDDSNFLGLSEIQKLHEKYRIIALVGEPGSGKTTASKRLVKTNKAKLCVRLQLACVRKKKCTLRQLLLDNNYPDLGKIKCKRIYEWICRNAKSLSIILDGLDQLPCTLENVGVKAASYETRLRPKQLIANLLSAAKPFLADAHVIITSRPHAMLQLSPVLRPNKTVNLLGLSDHNMERLFKAYAGEKADSLMAFLRNKAPGLLDLCHNPLMLVFTVWAFSDEDFADATVVTTVTEMFNKILRNLRRSEHTGTRDLQKIYKQLGELAWNATNKETIEISKADLNDVKLTPEECQDLVFAAVDGDFIGRKLFDGDEKLYFIHQTWQEYFSARYLADDIPMTMFKRRVREMSQDFKWSSVTRFLSGLLLRRPVKGLKEGKGTLH